MTADPLREQLIKIAKKLQEQDINLIIGGGYGLVLKSEYISQSGQQTRFKEQPISRSTNDLDIFLSTEIITKADKFTKIRDVLTEHGYMPIESAKFYQFWLPIKYEGLEKPIKIDILAGLPKDEKQLKTVKKDERRIRPHGVKNLHGRITEEAVTIETGLLQYNLLDENTPVYVFLPHPFTYITMKLFALRDRLEDEEKDFGAYHAFDIYRVISMMTEEEWEQSCTMRDEFAEELKIQEARQIVGELFSNDDSLGVLRIKQHAKLVETELLDENILALVKDLNELFPTIE
jgi:hypothetical protein